MLFILLVIPLVVGQADDKVGTSFECLLEINKMWPTRVDWDQLEVPPFFNNGLLDCLAVPTPVADSGGLNVAFSLMNIFFTTHHVPLLEQKRNLVIESLFGIIHRREDTDRKQRRRCASTLVNKCLTEVKLRSRWLTPKGDRVILRTWYALLPTKFDMIGAYTL